MVQEIPISEKRHRCAKASAGLDEDDFTRNSPKELAWQPGLCHRSDIWSPRLIHSIHNTTPRGPNHCIVCLTRPLGAATYFPGLDALAFALRGVSATGGADVRGPECGGRCPKPKERSWRGLSAETAPPLKLLSFQYRSADAPRTQPGSVSTYKSCVPIVVLVLFLLGTCGECFA